MKRSNLEQKVVNAFSNSVPDVLDNILEKCEEKKGFKKDMKVNKEKQPSGIFISSKMLGGFALAALVVGVGVFGVNTYNNNYRTDSIIGFDINPSVELLVNKKEEVIKANALNDEARQVIDGMKLEDVDVDVAVNALIGAMLKNGYLTVDSNSILVSVQNDDVSKGERLQREITSEIESLLSASKIEGAVLSQELVNDDVKSLVKYSDDYEISVGKARLINEVIDARVTDSKGNVYTFDTLAGLSINELNVLLNAKKANVENIASSGTASKTSYIGDDKAKSIAFADAGVKESNVRDLDVEFDADDGRLIYEVEFDVNGKEYEYDINAKTGDIIYRHTEKDDDYVSSESANTHVSTNTNTDTQVSTTKKKTTKKASSYIGEAKAKSIAFKNAGVSSSEVRALKVELDRDDGIVSYEIEFEVGNTEYNYDIHATSGKILEKDIDRD